MSADSLTIFRSVRDLLEFLEHKRDSFTLCGEDQEQEARMTVLEQWRAKDAMAAQKSSQVQMSPVLAAFQNSYHSFGEEGDAMSLYDTQFFKSPTKESSKLQLAENGDAEDALNVDSLKEDNFGMDDLDLALDESFKENVEENASGIGAFVGFQTAGGKKIAAPTEDSLRKAQQLLVDVGAVELPLGMGKQSPGALNAVREAETKFDDGFKTAKGSFLPPPSKEALAKAQSLVDGEEEPVCPAFAGFKTGRGSSLPPPSAEAMQRARTIMEDEPPAEPPVASTGFQTGKGKSLPPPSKEALKRARQLIEDPQSAASVSAHEANVSVPGVGFQTGRGSKLPAPSEAALKRAKNLMQTEEEPMEMGSNAGFQTGKGRVLPPPSDEAMARAQRLDIELPSEAPSKKARPSRPSLALKKPLASANGLPSRLASFPMSESWKRPRSVPSRAAKETAAKPPRSVTPLFELNDSGERYKLREYFKSSKPCCRIWAVDEYLDLGIGLEILQITSADAKDYSFMVNGMKWGAGEAHEDLLRLGAEGSLVSLQWTTNAYRWIVWKFAGMIRSFPFDYGPENLCPSFVLQQLLYRYEREIAQGKRPLLRKIVEQDDTPSRYMVLMVADVRVEEGLVELSDGWYSAWAKIDAPLQELLKKGKLFSGMKLEICSAQLQAEEAVPALDASDLSCDCRLVLFRNSVRRARWDSRLGWIRKRGFLQPLGHIHSLGGLIPAVRVVITRKYPLCFVEEDTEKKQRVVRQERDYHQYLDNLQAQQAQLNVDEAEDSFSLAKRFSCFLKVRVGEVKSGREAIITFWHVHEGLLSSISEGFETTILGLRASSIRTAHSASGMAPRLLHLSSTKSTMLCRHDLLPNSPFARQLRAIAELSRVPAGEDVDVVGVYMEKSLVVNPHSSQWTAWLGDAEGGLVCLQGSTGKGTFPGGMCNQSGDLFIVKDAAVIYQDTRQSVSVLAVTEFTEIKKMLRPMAGEPLSNALWKCDCSASQTRLDQLRS